MHSSGRALRVAVTVAFRADPRRSTAVVVLSTVASLVGVLSAYWLRQIVDAAAAGDEAAALAGAVRMGLTTAVAVLASTTVTHMQFPLKENTGLHLDRRIVALVGEIPTVEHHERPAYLDRVDVLRREMYVLGFAGFNTARALALLVQIGATGALLVAVNPLLLAVPLFALPSLWAGGRAERIRQSALDAAADRSRRARHLFELATSPRAAKELRVFGVGDELRRRHDTDWQETDRLLDAAAVRGVAWTAVGWLIFSAGYAGATALIVGQAVNGDATIGDVVLTLFLVAMVNAEVSAAAGTVSTFVRMTRVADRYLWLSDLAAASRPDIADPVAVPDRLVDGIELRGVSFRYQGTDVDVLTGVDLRLPAGATVAVVGANGAGKSTLVKLLCRFYPPTAGVITVDGIDLRRIAPVAWRARMSAGFQDFAHLELLARQAVGVGDLVHMDDDEVVRGALGRAASAEVIEALPAGLETQLGSSFDEGVELSGGQWQKLALARAMMRPDPLLLVLDEPTAALDADTEFGLFARYTAAATAVAQRTGAITVLVSHRFSTVRMADLIIVVDGGRVAEVGSHRDLMDGSGLYAELYELQARAYR